MKKIIYYTFLFILGTHSLFAQSIDDAFSQRKMQKDLAVFKEIRMKANSGLYKYRTESQIDSIYNWAEKEIKKSSTYLDFYNIICQLTDFEGSLHNGTYWSDKLFKSISNEPKGYFPLPLKIIEGKLIVNIENEDIPLGSEIISINGHNKKQLLNELGKYYTTDGFNATGKKIGIDKHLSRYYRYNFGLADEFKVVYKKTKVKQNQSIVLSSVSYKKYYENFANRHSQKLDDKLYDDVEKSDYYSLKKTDSKTAILTINSFSLGSGSDKSHLKYKHFLDSIFVDLNQNNFENLIVDIRNNGGGNKPNDMVTLSYLANSQQQEIRTAWISFTESVPHWKHFQIDIPFYLKSFSKGKLNKMMKKELPIVKDNRRYYRDIEVYQPNENRFKGQVYLIVDPAVASAASLFASMVASNTDAIVIGEETSGGYYGHNGSFSVEYKLPKSNFTTNFSIVNLTQDVKKKNKQPFGRGVRPDFIVEQTFEDFLNHEDTQMEYVLDLIRKNETK